MAVPQTATPIPQVMDPADVVDFLVRLSQGSVGTEMLQAGESVASFTLTLTAEAVATGLALQTTGGYATVLSGTDITFWLAVASGMQGNAMFDGAGVTVGIVLTIITNASPARTKQRTILITVAQR